MVMKKAIILSDMAFEFWLPERYSQQNFFTYQFGFLMNPIKKNHPRTEYIFHRIPANPTIS